MEQQAMLCMIISDIQLTSKQTRAMRKAQKSTTENGELCFRFVRCHQRQFMCFKMLSKYFVSLYSYIPNVLESIYLCFILLANETEREAMYVIIMVKC